VTHFAASGSNNFKARSIIVLGDDAVRMMFILQAPQAVRNEVIKLRERMS
jgi:hypothetical protein